MKVFRRIIVVALMAGFLAGCFIPTPVSIATNLIDIALLVTTGKTSTDHLISAVMMQDCVLFRLLQGEEICIDEMEEVPQQVPEDLYLRVKQADGTVENEKVTRIQKVHPISEMRDTRPKGEPMQEIPTVRPAGRPGTGSTGLQDPAIDTLPVL